MTTFAYKISNPTYMKRETMEQREQSQACLYFAESRQRKAKGQYARATVAMPENEDKQPVRQELAYEIENRDINDEFTVKF
jgi:hypothetical protein